MAGHSLVHIRKFLTLYAVHLDEYGGESIDPALEGFTQPAIRQPLIRSSYSGCNTSVRETLAMYYLPKVIAWLLFGVVRSQPQQPFDPTTCQKNFIEDQEISP